MERAGGGKFRQKLALDLLAISNSRGWSDVYPENGTKQPNFSPAADSPLHLRAKLHREHNSGA